MYMNYIITLTEINDYYYIQTKPSIWLTTWNGTTFANFCM